MYVRRRAPPEISEFRELSPLAGPYRVAAGIALLVAFAILIWAIPSWPFRAGLGALWLLFFCLGGAGYSIRIGAKDVVVERLWYGFPWRSTTMSLDVQVEGTITFGPKEEWTRDCIAFRDPGRARQPDDVVVYASDTKAVLHQLEETLKLYRDPPHRVELGAYRSAPDTTLVAKKDGHE